MSLKDQIDVTRLPQHIAVIMDGNGRWAKQHGKNRVFGHSNGVNAVRETSEACAELGVKHLTLYAFSTENWNRPQLEVSALMTLLLKTINGELKTLIKNDIRLGAIGDIDSLPKSVANELRAAIEKTAGGKRMELILALSYSGKNEIIRAVKNIAQKVKDNELGLNDINEQLISNNLYTAGRPDPELLIRTSGELRVSNFLLWQLAYAEFYFTDKFWPEFNKEELYKAIIDYQNRERRFGKTSEQVVTDKK
ncbi:MAG TPA: isoprenyl transferase [Chitinophagales bacterium]|nr:isoprenyl transferase [Chitinophagales bacterium]